MNIQFSKFIVPVLLIAVGLAAAMFILPVLGAVLIGAFALSGLLWLSGKIFAVFQGQTDYSEDNPGDYYRTDNNSGRGSSIVPKNWHKSEAVDAEIISEEKVVKKD